MNHAIEKNRDGIIRRYAATLNLKVDRIVYLMARETPNKGHDY